MRLNRPAAAARLPMGKLVTAGVRFQLCTPAINVSNVRFDLGWMLMLGSVGKSSFRVKLSLGIAGPKPLMVAIPGPAISMSQFGENRAWPPPETASLDVAPSRQTSPLRVTGECID